MQKRPAARDGHSGILIESSQGRPYMFVFGGDRHQMPFNDTFILNLVQELSMQNIQVWCLAREEGTF